MAGITHRPSDEDKPSLRAMARRVIDADGGYFTPSNLLGDHDPTLDDISLEDLATDEITIIYGMWGQSRTSGEDSYVAYSLGFDTWYVVHTDSADEVMSHSVIPDADWDHACQQIVRRWIAETGPEFCSLPTEFSSIYDNQPWFIRELAEAMGRSCGDPVSTVADDLLRGHEVDESGRDAILAYWWSAVEPVHVINVTEVPGLATVSTEDDPLFQSWVERVPLAWRDTGQSFDTDNAELLRVTCQFLGLSR